MIKPLRLLFMNRRYDDTVGGVERASIRLANEMAARGHECHILSLDLPNAKMPFNLDQRVQWHRVSSVNAQQKAGWGERMGRFRRIRSVLTDNKIDVAMGFQDGAYLSVVTAAAGTGVSVIAAERNAPTRFDHLASKLAKPIAFNSFRLADRVTVQCPSYVAQYPAYIRGKISVVPNSVDAPDGHADPAGKDKAIKELLFVGRLDYQKNIATLVDAFSQISPAFPEWILRIVGAGPDLAKLQRQAKDLSVQDKVVFDGIHDDVSLLYRRAHLFCLPSLWEGFPNVLGEAMAHGLPSIGFKSCSGVCDLIVHDRSGLLVEGDVRDARPLAACLSRLMRDGDLRDSMGRNATEEMKAYLPEKIYAQWETLFQSLATKHRP